MMSRIIWSSIFTLILLNSASALAAPNVIVGTDSVAAGGSATISMTFQADGTTAAFDFRYTFDDTQFTATPACVGSLDTTGAANATVACSVVGNEVRVLVSGAAEFPVPPITSGDQSLGSVSFQSLANTPATTYPLAITQQNYFDAAGSTVTPTQSTDGAITVVGPAYASSPTPGSNLVLGPVIQNDTDPTTPVDIDNIGAAGSSLDGSCTITNNPTVFSVDSGSPFAVPEAGPNATVVVSCDSSQAIAAHAGEMTCTHNGDNMGDAVYPLSCTITAGPQPAYSSNPADGTPIAMGPVEQGDPITPVDVAISNSGDTGTTLAGTCSITGGIGKITVADGSFSVLQGGTADIQTVSCDSSEQGNYSATLECTHDGSNGPTASYAVTCDVGPAGGAIFRSDPLPGSSTPIGVDVVVDDTPDPTAPLQFFNDADVGDMDLDIACSITAGGVPISVLPDISAGIQIPPQLSAGVDFTCDTAAEGNYSVTYTCDYTVGGPSMPAGDVGVVQQAIYTYTCDVRVPVSDVDPTPASGTTLPVVIDSAGGTGSTTVEFTEVAGEGENGELLAECSLAFGTHYEIITPLPGDYPVAIAAGDPVMVTVEGTDPNDGSSPTDTLTCTYTDSANTDPGVEVTYPLTMEVAGAGAARFAVTKTFADDRDADVTVTLTCDTGLPLQQSLDISPGDPVAFVVTSFEDGLMDCVVTEGGADAYLTNYVASGDSQSADDVPDAPGCHFFAVAGGDINLCAITNTVEPVDVVIEKEWVIDGAVSDEVNQYYQLTLYCDSMIIGGTPSNGNGIPMSGTQSIVLGHWYKVFNGMGNEIFIAEVVPDYPSTSCWVYEDANTSGIEVDNDCMDIEVSAGNGDRCKITNTVFFEGIPTLSQYGLALMALLMLGVGMVGFRRFA